MVEWLKSSLRKIISLSLEGRGKKLLVSSSELTISGEGLFLEILRLKPKDEAAFFMSF